MKRPKVKSVATIRREDSMPFYQRLGRRVRKDRVAYPMTQQQLADKLGFTRASIANLENGRQRVLAHDILKIAKAIGATYTWLMGDIC